MSDLIRYSHTAKCDWPDCGVLGSADEWIGWPSYHDAIEVLEDQPDGQDWYHDAENHRDYCGADTGIGRTTNQSQGPTRKIQNNLRIKHDSNTAG